MRLALVAVKRLMIEREGTEQSAVESKLHPKAQGCGKDDVRDRGQGHAQAEGEGQR